MDTEIIQHNFDCTVKDYINNLMFKFIKQECLEFQIVKINKDYYVTVMNNNPEEGGEPELIFMSNIKGQTNFILLDKYNSVGLGELTLDKG